MEHVSISGYVNFDTAKFSIVKLFTDKFQEVGIEKGYLSSTFSKVSDSQMELSIFADCVIVDSTAYRNILLNLSELIEEESSIFLKEDLNEPWTSVTTLKPRESSLVVQKIIVADNNTVTKFPS